MNFRKAVVPVNLLAVLFCVGKPAAAEVDSLTMRYTAAGVPDTTFNGTGYSVWSNSGADAANDVFVDSNGRVVTCGYYTTANGGRALAIRRLNANGSADSTFGVSGLATMNYGATTDAVGCTPDGSGRILVAAKTGSLGGILIRFNSNGSLDLPFGPQDVGYTSTVLTPSDIKVAQGGKIVVAGTQSIQNPDYAVRRFTSDGNNDATFGTGGGVTTDITSDSALGVAVDSLGRVVITGYSTSGLNVLTHVLRYTAAGVLDWVTSIPFPSPYIGGMGTNVAIDTSDRIVVAGTAYSTFPTPRAYTLARLTPNGALDTTFSGDGKVTWDMSDPGSRNGMALGTDGKIVLAGRVLAEFGKYIVVMSRWETNGNLDTTFGPGGIVAYSFSPRNAQVFSVAVDGSNRPVLAGQVE